MKRPGSLPRHTSLPARRKPMAARVASLKPSGPIKARNAKRATAEFARAYGGKARAQWVTDQACIVFACLRPEPRQNAHIRTDGAGRKADAALIVPLCAYHHREQHQIGTAAFALRHMLNLEVEAARTEAAWQAHHAARIAAKARKAAAKQAAAVIPSIAPAPVAGRTAA